MTTTQLIGVLIKEERNRMGLTQKRFGAKLAISGSYIGFLENDKKRVNPNLLKDISMLTGKPVSYFYGEKCSCNKRSFVSRLFS